MVSPQQKAQLNHRRRQKQNGIRRVEVNVHKDDVALLRQIVDALSSPDRKAEVRAWLREHFGAGKAAGFKALLTSASLEGIDLRRNRQAVRDIDL